MAPVPVWFLIGFLQYRLLQPYRRRSLWWLVATFSGGILGMFVGGPAMIMMMPPSEVIVLSSTTTPEWMFASYPLPPAAVAGALAAAVLGLAQAPSLGQGFRRGLFWILLSALSGAAAAFVGGLAHWAYAHYMSEVIPRRCRSQHIDAHHDRPLDRHCRGHDRLRPADGTRHAVDDQSRRHGSATLRHSARRC